MKIWNNISGGCGEKKLFPIVFQFNAHSCMCTFMSSHISWHRIRTKKNQLIWKENQVHGFVTKAEQIYAKWIIQKRLSNGTKEITQNIFQLEIVCTFW